jgi:hypothetical protein
VRKACWLAKLPGAGECDGRLRKCHLISRQTIVREVGKRYAWDPAVWVWGCGGAMGVSGHHGMLDYSRKLRIPRVMLPPELEAFAEKHGIVWWLDRTYGLPS